MKKYFMLTLLLAFMTVGAFALDVGGGLMFGIGSVYDRMYAYEDYKGIKYIGSDFGLTGFFGWKYFDFTLGLSHMTLSGEEAHSCTVFHAGCDIKIPITISSNVRIYPMLGFDLATGEIASYLLPTYGPYGGVGADILLFENMFVRGNVLYVFMSEGVFLIRACAGWRF